MATIRKNAPRKKTTTKVEPNLRHVWLASLGLLVAAACFVWEYRQTRNRKPMACFNAFLHNHWAGLAIFLAIVADYALR